MLDKILIRPHLYGVLCFSFLVGSLQQNTMLGLYLHSKLPLIMPVEEEIACIECFVRPSNLSEKRIDEYIEGKYGKLGVHHVWHHTAMSFTEVIQEFESWICGHNFWNKERGGPLTRAAFVTCGNWDIKTKIPEQCLVCSMQIPPYLLEWINLKDIYLNFYNRRASGMKTMLNELNIPLLGSHHLGIDDTTNISRVIQRMLADGALFQITARRITANRESARQNPAKLGTVEYLLENRFR